MSILQARITISSGWSNPSFKFFSETEMVVTTLACENRNANDWGTSLFTRTAFFISHPLEVGNNDRSAAVIFASGSSTVSNW